MENNLALLWLKLHDFVNDFPNQLQKFKFVEQDAFFAQKMNPEYTKQMLNSVLFEIGFNSMAGADEFLERFLRARKDVDKAFEMLVNFLNFRITVNVVKIIQFGDSVFPDAQLNGKFVFKKDKLGHPCCYNLVRTHFKESNTDQGHKDHLIWFLETIRLFLEPPITRATIVFDLNNAGYKNVDMNLTKYVVRVLQDYYPESLAACYVVNANFVISSLWKVIKPWLDKEVALKIKFINQNELPLYIDLENIPEMLGGLASDENTVYKSGNMKVKEMSDFTELTKFVSSFIDSSKEYALASLNNKEAIDPRQHETLREKVNECDFRYPTQYHRDGILKTGEQPKWK